MSDFMDNRLLYGLIIYGLILLYFIPVLIKPGLNSASNINRILRSEIPVDISVDWKDEQDKPVDLSGLYKLKDINRDENISIYYDLFDILPKGQRINFLSPNIHIRAYINCLLENHRRSTLILFSGLSCPGCGLSRVVL